MTVKESKKPVRPASPTRRIAFWLVAFNYAQAAISFLVNFWLARKLGAEEYGLLGYGIVVGQICTTVVGYSSERTLVRDLVQSSDMNAMLSASLVLRTVMAFLVLGYCIAWALISDTLGPKAIPMLLCSCWGALSALTSRAWLDSHYKMHVHATILFAEKALYAVCVVILVSFAFEGHYAIVAASCLLLARVVSMFFEWSYANRTFRLRMDHVRENLKFLIQQNSLVLGAAIANLLMTHANQLLLERERGTESLAYYSIAFQVILMIQLFQSQVVRLLGPRTAELTNVTNLTNNTLRADLLRFMGYMLLVSAALLAPVVILAPWIIKITLKEEFLAAVPVLRILACWALIYGPGLILNQFLLGLRLQKTYFVITIIAGGIAAILGPILVPIYGINSVAWILLISHSFSIAAQLLFVMHKTKQLQTITART